MIPGLTKPLRNCSSSELNLHSEDDSVRRSLYQRRFSIGLLEETDRLAREIGKKKACAQAGMSVEVLKKYRTSKRGPLYAGKSKYTREQKLECIKLQKQLHQSGFSKSTRSAGLRPERDWA